MIDPGMVCLRCFAKLREPQGVCPRCGLDNAACENAANQLECGSILAGSYFVGLALGQGGFGITYAGFDLKLDLKVAIKEYFPGECVTRDSRTHATVVPLPGERKTFFEHGRERFVSEARALARFGDEPAIVSVRGFFEENGTAYIVMSFVEGETLKTYAERRGGRLPAREALALLRPILLSLERVHENELLHRDISPDNIMRRADGTPVLIDFGAARQISAMGEHSNSVILKHGYAPEEQYRTHGRQGPWTDVYALCATLYRLTTGVTPPQALDRLSREIPLLPPNKLGADFSPAQEQALLRGLAVTVSERTQNMQELAQTLFAEAPAYIQPDPSPRRAKTADTRLSVPSTQSVTRARIKKLAIMFLEIFLLFLVCYAVYMFLDRLIAARGNRGEASSSSGTLAPSIATAALYAAEWPPGAASTETPAPTLEPTRTPNFELQYQSALETARKYKGRITAGADFTLIVNDDGTVIRLGGNGIHTSGWSDIRQVAAYEFIAVGLHSDGTVVATGPCDFGEADVGSWTNVLLVDCGYRHTVGLTADGQVLYTGVNKGNRASCRSWTNLLEIDAGAEHLIGITNDGGVFASGYDDLGACDTDAFTDIVGGDVGGLSTFCIRADGTVIAIGRNVVGEDDVSGWTNIVAVSAGQEHTVGLRSDGTVVAVGSNAYGECDVENWTDIVAVAAGKRHTVGLKSDGTLIATGSDSLGQCDVSGLKIW